MHIQMEMIYPTKCLTFEKFYLINLSNYKHVGLCAKHFESRKFEFYSIKTGFSNAVIYRVLMHDCFDALHIKCSLQKMHCKCWRRYQIPTG